MEPEESNRMLADGEAAAATRDVLRKRRSVARTIAYAVSIGTVATFLVLVLDVLLFHHSPTDPAPYIWGLFAALYAVVRSVLPWNRRRR